MRKLLLGLAFSLFTTLALAQGCGNTNPNCIVPLRPVGDASNAAASTAFINGQALTVGSPLTIGNPATQNAIQLSAQGTGNSPLFAAVGIDTNIGMFFAAKGTGFISFNNNLGCGTVGGVSCQIFLNGNVSGTSSIGVGATGGLFLNALNATTTLSPGGGFSATLAFNGSSSGQSSIFTNSTGSTITLSPGFGSNNWAFDNTGLVFCNSSSSGRCQIELENTTNDVNSTQLFMIKNRNGGNTLNGDVLGAVAADGFANGAFQPTAAIQFQQTGASSGSNIPSQINFFVSDATGQQNHFFAMTSPGDFTTASQQSFHPQVIIQNTTVDANQSFFVNQKSRNNANTITSDSLGAWQVQGFANGGYQQAGQAGWTQIASSSGNNIPVVFQLKTSNAAGLLNQTWQFDQNAHVITFQTAVPTLTAGCNGAGSSVSGTDMAGTVTGQTAAATTCTLTFTAAYGATPNCVVSGQNSPLTGAFTPSTGTLVVNFASTANYKWSYVCFGS